MSGLVGLTGLAGCTGGGGGDGGDGGDGGGGDGGGGDGGGGQQTPTPKQGQKGGTLTIRAFPISEFAVTHLYMQKSGILEEELNKVGWDLDMKFKFENLPPFISGQSDMVEMGSIEAGRVASNEDLNLAFFLRHSSTFTGTAVKAGGPYDPDNTGSVQASVDKMIEDNAKFGIFSWGAGNTTPQQVILQGIFGYKMRQEGGDVNVFTVQPPSIPKLLTKGDIAIGTTSPLHGGAKHYFNGDIKPLWWDNVILPENDFGLPNFANYVTRESFLRENPEAVKAFFRARKKTGQWFNSDEGVNTVPTTEAYRKKIPNAGSEEVATYAMDWATAQHRGKVGDVKFANNAPKVRRNPKLTEEFIKQDKKFGQSGVELGIIPETEKSVKYVPVTGDTVPDF